MKLAILNKFSPFQKKAHIGRTTMSILLGSALVFVGSAYSDREDLSLSFYGFDSEAYSEAGQAGLKQILSGKMFDLELPMSGLYFQQTIAASKADELGYDPTSAAGKYYSEGSLPSFDADADSVLDLGLSPFERDGKEYASLNCFACHAGVVNGVVVAGLASNSTVQRSTPLTDVRGEVVRGDNFGQYAVWNLAASIANPEETGLLTSAEETELTEVMKNTQRPPVQAMPWWTMKYKVRDYWYGDGGPHDAAHFSLNFSIGNEEINEHHTEHVAMTARALAFARETQSPVYPEKLDASLVQMGKEIFHGRLDPEDRSTFLACFQCHGEYTKKASALDYSMPGSWIVNYSGSELLRNVGTDPSYSEVIEEFAPIVAHLDKLAVYYDAQGTPELTPVDRPLKGIGYIPPPLVGVWTTAPYFHNGSVPTIEAVLNSKLRPEIWDRDKSPHAYNMESVGLEYTALTKAQYADLAATAAVAPDKSQAKVDMGFIYDTSNFGRGKMGHTWGDSLSNKERMAVIEFLKSLSGSDMPPQSTGQQQANL
ncbi:MAG: mono/diheme cytochrome c family protein [Pseudohongiellaceae bacterium]|jgi:mono/diheme cytochrome c family protein